MKKILIIIFTMLASYSYSQQLFTGGNECRIRILTDKKEYEFVTHSLEARVNNALERFEFMIPVETIRALRDSSDLDFIQALTQGTAAIEITAAFPGNQVDYSFLKTSNTVGLPGELKIGSLRFHDDVEFGGSMPADKLYFNLQLYLREGNHYLAQVNNEHILEIELAARGDRMVGLSSN
jgi:hypothetical protein